MRVALTRRTANGLGAAACAGMMGFALFAEHVLGLEPCPLCVFQRIAVIALGVVLLVAALHNPGRGGAWAYGVLAGLVAATGAGIAAWHVRMQNLPASEVPACGPDLSYMLEAFPLGEMLTMVFSGSGECAEVVWRFLGLSMPTWVLIGLSVMAAAAIFVNGWLPGPDGG